MTATTPPQKQKVCWRWLSLRAQNFGMPTNGHLMQARKRKHPSTPQLLQRTLHTTPQTPNVLVSTVAAIIMSQSAQSQKTKIASKRTKRSSVMQRGTRHQQLMSILLILKKNGSLLPKQRRPIVTDVPLMAKCTFASTKPNVGSNCATNQPEMLPKTNLRRPL